MTLNEATEVLEAIDVENITPLSDYPNDNDGLSSTELKTLFDKAGVDLKEFLLLLIQAIIDGDAAAARGITQEGMPGSLIQNGTITAAKLDSSVTSLLTIDDNSITEDKLCKTVGSEAVVTNAIRAKAVTAAKIADAAIKAIHLDDGIVDTANIAEKAVTNTQLADGAVNSRVIGPGAVTYDKTYGVQKEVQKRIISLGASDFTLNSLYNDYECIKTVNGISYPLIQPVFIYSSSYTDARDIHNSGLYVAGATDENKLKFICDDPTKIGPSGISIIVSIFDD